MLQMYELYDPCTVMFFFRNKHMVRSVKIYPIIISLDANSTRCAISEQETIIKSIGCWMINKS